MTYKERLVLFIDHKKLNNKKFETKCGLSNGYVHNLSPVNPPNKTKHEQILEAFPDLNGEWLMTGEGKMLKEEQASSIVQTVSGNGNDATIVTGSKINMADEWKKLADAAIEKAELLKGRITQLEAEVAYLRKHCDDLTEMLNKRCQE